MDSEEKVFRSKISKASFEEKNNNLYDLLTIVPATPVSSEKENRNVNCDFHPILINKFFVPKKLSTSKLKVKTVRDIRSIFEKDTFDFLPEQLERQKSILLRKIRDGKSQRDCTKKLAKNILDSDCPISRSLWQIICNINPGKEVNAKQFVLWNKRLIQVNGSKGGKCKLMFDFDKLAYQYGPKASTIKKPAFKKYKRLLNNSLSVKFKPGPLRRKTNLDDSYQKHLSNVELVDLPKPVLEVQPACGTVLDLNITKLLSAYRYDEGLITKNWAEFAVSVVSSVSDNTVKQLNPETYVSFDLNYDRNKKRILMRRDEENVMIYRRPTVSFTSNFNEKEINEDVENVVTKLLNAVEISLIQDDIYSTNDEPMLLDEVPSTEIHSNGGSGKEKKKRFSELDRLDVTVIKLSENETTTDGASKPCYKPFCNLGCVCDSLNNKFDIRPHCELVECMFSCKCKVPNEYKNTELLQGNSSNIITGLINFDNKINSRLAKEEQKFHQTVILNGEKSIVLKSHKRNRKSTKRYAEFCSEAGIECADSKRKKMLAIVANKINCENIEPWCMVHNLYKCFCRGKFIESSVTNLNLASTDSEKNTTTKESDEIIEVASDSDTRWELRSNTRNSRKKSLSENKTIVEYDLDFDQSVESTCARTDGYQGRKYSNGYYQVTHNKILEMEVNDTILQKRISKIIDHKVDENDFTSSSVPVCSNDGVSTDSGVTDVTSYNKSKKQTTELKELAKQTTELKKCELQSTELQETDKQSSELKETNYMYHKNLQFFGPNNNDNRQKLVTWLETCYKAYKERLDRGVVKTALSAPTKGKLVLYPWDFILSRYREKKNLFLISKIPPFRLYIAVNNKNPFFDNCFNIDDIRFAELNKYPSVVKNLLTNATDLQNNFCILGGWDICWELVGSVTKLNAGSNTAPSEAIFDTEKILRQESYFNDKDMNINISGPVPQETCNSLLNPTSSRSSNTKPIIENNDRSKWFLMTLENDFSEIQFYKKGFYVKHGSILQAIELARVSGKTVRLSSQSLDINTEPQFGIYAIPNTSQFCVFVGPYEMDEALGIETVKSIIETRKLKKTRGVWIVTNKVDDMQVINNPMSFIPSKDEQSEMMLAIGSTYNIKTVEHRYEQSTLNETKYDEVQDVEQQEDMIQDEGTLDAKMQDDIMNQEDTKQDDKSEEAQDLEGAPNNLQPTMLQKVSSGYIKNSANNVLPLKLVKLKKLSKVIVVPKNTLDTQTVAKCNKPIAEIAPQIKITSVYSEHPEARESMKSMKPEARKGMFILKPEEINKKVFDSPGSSGAVPETENSESSRAMNMDIENFLVSSRIRTISDEEIMVLSDDEDDATDTKYQTIWIQSNILGLGWIPGQRNNKTNMISFEFPGFKYSQFYAEHEAFDKINQVVSRKIFVPNSIKIEWKVLESIKEVKGIKLTAECLKENSILTKTGIQDVRIFKGKAQAYMNKKKLTAGSSTKTNDEDATIMKIENEDTFSQDMKEELEYSDGMLVETSNELWNKTVSKENAISTSLNLSEERKVELSISLNEIIELNDNDDE